ncbi:MAG: hypothetical protein FWG27_01355 [Treponema sp.]|nr:hypothetical protein [Treponema sp.]
MKLNIALYSKTVLFFLFAGVIRLEAQFPSLDASPKAYEYASLMAGNNWRYLAEASLWASSVNAGPGAEEKAAVYLNRIMAAAADLAAEDIPTDPKERGEYVLNFLHRRFLKSYSEYQTRVDEIFVSGRYNCVSSAVLYMVLGLSVNLDVEGVMTRDHAFAMVNTGTEKIDVETTNPYGFDPGNRKEFHDAFGKTTGFAYVPSKNYRDRAAINGAELVSLILSNRIAVLEKGNRFAEAVPLAINRAVFLTGDPSAETMQNTGAQNTVQNKADFFEDPRQDMMCRLYNLGAYLIRTGKEDDAIAWVEYVEGRFSDPRRWQELVKAAANNKLVKLIRAKKTPDARSALTQLKPKLSDENYRELDAMVLDAETGDKINAVKNPGDAEAVLVFLAEVWERLPPGRRNDLQTAAILSEVDRLGKTRNWTGSMRWLTNAMEKYGSNPRMETAFNTLRQNRVSELHNEFASLFNKKDYTAAKASIEKSLQEFPGERQLIQDLVLVERALRQ